MIGILFHGPEVFDTGWAQKIIAALKPVDATRCVLAGTMGRTAVIDSGLENIEFWSEMPSQCLHDLASQVSAVVIANFGKSLEAGMVFGAMVVERAGVSIPVVQVECSGPFYVEWLPGICEDIKTALKGLNLPQRDKIKINPAVWEADGKVYRRMTTAAPGDFILVNGIMVGVATDTEVVLACENGHICDIQGAAVKPHGIEKLDRFGGIDLKKAKLASTPTIRRTAYVPRKTTKKGRGILFLDHAGMHIYELMGSVAGVVTVGDDTTAVTMDILSRYQIPVIGIVDGDEDVILKNGGFTPGSVRLTVAKDDEFGLKVLDKVFKNKKQIDAGFEEVLKKIIALAGRDLVAQQRY